MSATTSTMTSASGTNTPAFWERLWRSSGLQSIGCFIIAYLIYPAQPKAGAPADVVAALYSGDRSRILIAAVFGGLAVLNLMWFAAALRATLAEEGKDGWGAAVTASSAAVGALFLIMMSVTTALAFSIAGSGNQQLASGLNDFIWACAVMSSFPRAMLIMSGSFGFWRAKLISSSQFSVCVGAVILGVLGGTTWLSGGFWAPDGAYSRFVWPLIGFMWVVYASRVLLTRSPGTRASW
jgi:hypothetical protein